MDVFILEGKEAALVDMPWKVKLDVLMTVNRRLMNNADDAKRRSREQNPSLRLLTDGRNLLAYRFRYITVSM